MLLRFLEVVLSYHYSFVTFVMYHLYVKKTYVHRVEVFVTLSAATHMKEREQTP